MKWSLMNAARAALAMVGLLCDTLPDTCEILYRSGRWS
jgi:hypothetical protein